jgi:cytochrome c-type biogenesis protein CcmH/NrfG
MPKTKSQSIQVRIPGTRVHEWAELTGQPDSKLAAFFVEAALYLIENEADEGLIAARGVFKRRLSAMVEASKLRKQAHTLTKRAAQVVREAKGTASVLLLAGLMLLTGCTSSRLFPSTLTIGAYHDHAAQTGVEASLSWDIKLGGDK